MSLPGPSRLPAAASTSSSPSSSRPSPASRAIPPTHFLARQLPPDHFLSQQQQQQQLLTSTSPQHSPSAEAKAGDFNPFDLAALGLAPDTSTLAAADFDIDVRSGFLPPDEPVKRLSGDLERWEELLDAARALPLRQGGGGAAETPERKVLAEEWREAIRRMPIMHPQLDIRHARRGHLVLAFLSHFYLHSQPAAEGKEANTIPAPLAQPFVALSEQLDLPPILTYATTCLWNWELIDRPRGLALDNLRIVTTFTGTKSEEHFFLTSVLIELRGVRALELMRLALDEAFVGDRLARRRIARYLTELAVVIKDLERILADVRTDCDPATFYWGIRPWFRGGDTGGWHYEGVDADDVRRGLTGPSAGQSSLIHALDVFLGVNHATGRPDATFMQRMQEYMPGHHRAFLTHLSNDDGPKRLRELASDEDVKDSLPKAFDNALLALKSLRDEHMRIATLYIVSQARKAPPPEHAQLPETFAGRAGPEVPVVEGAKGTGGTDLVRFLKACRTNTTLALLSERKEAERREREAKAAQEKEEQERARDVAEARA